MVLALGGAAPAITVLAGMARAYARAAALRRARRSQCPFEDDDDAPRPLPREVMDVVRESLALGRLVAAAARPLPAAWRSAVPIAAEGPIVLLLPERGLPRASLARLGRRLSRDLAASIHVVALPRADERAHPATVADRLEALASRAPGRPIVAVGHGAGGVLARRAATLAALATLRVVTIAAPHGDAEPIADRAQVVNLYSLHDAFVPPARAHLPGAFNIAVRDEGHLSLVLRRRPYTLLSEHLVEGDTRAAAS
jgi:hypothetical protein